MKISYLYDSLDRTTEIRYPAQYGLAGSPRKLIEPTYDVASRLSSLKVDSVVQAGDIVYNSSDQTESIKIGTAGTNQVTETYEYDGLSGLLMNQKVIKGGSNLLDLSYDYAKNNSVGTGTGKTGHLTKTTDNLNSNKNKEYEFDALGRLTKAKGGVQSTNFSWQQTYSYDRFGNRLNVIATGNGIDGQPVQKDGIGNLTYDNSTNRITNSGVNYDVAGNQTRALAEDGVTWLKYEYDAANRLQVIKKDSDNSYLEAFQFGSTNQRLMKTDYALNQTTIYAGDVEYTEYVSTIMTWTKSYVRLGDSILSTITPNGSGGETTEFNHPDRLGTRITTNQTAGTSTEQASLPFGTALGSETSRSESKRFTSYDRSVRTGLDYAINRTYDSKLGRFTQVDPIKMASVSLSAPQTLNLYSYCGNDPINHTDSNGLFWGFFKKLFKWIIAAVVVALVVIAILKFNFPAGQGVSLIKQLIAILGLVSAIASAAGSVLYAAGYVKASTILNFVSQIASGIGNILSKNTPQRTPNLNPGNSAGSLSDFLIKRGNTIINNFYPCAPTIPKLIAQFQRLLYKLFGQESGHRGEKPLENGGYIYQRENGALFFQRADESTRGSDEIKLLANPPTIKGARLVAIAHTHPYTAIRQDYYNKQGNLDLTGPSGRDGFYGDVQIAAETLIPNLVVYEQANGKAAIWGVGPYRVSNESCKKGKVK